jgi:predicted RNase H-like nuclease (RuvC/YqgF family)
LDEKTSLHTELRQIKAEIESRLKGQQSQNNNMPYNHHNHELESSLKKLTNERDNLLDTVRKQSVQIEQYRKECSGLEAKLVLIQQDRLDTQV